MAKNVIFSSAVYDHTTAAKHKAGRVDLLAQDVADELNTYRTFGVFKSYSNTYMEEVDADGNLKDKKSAGPGKATHPGTPGVRSLFNKYSAVLTGNKDEGWEGKGMTDVVRELVEKVSDWRASNNVPLLDTPENRAKLNKHNGCTVRELVEKSRKGHFGNAVYSYSDFMYCKHLGKVPNNYLITLRRYPAPISDGVIPIGIGEQRKNEGKVNSFMPLGTMVTWMGVSGNDMKNILKYSYSMPFEEKSADFQQVEKQGGQNGVFNSLETIFNSKTRALVAGGTEVPAFSQGIGKFFNVGQGFDPIDPMHDKTKVYGPIDRVKKIYMRGQGGLDHVQTISLVFEYELRAYNGINPRQAMLDLLASIFTVTYTTGNFWGGGYNGTFVTQSSAFQNLSIFKCRGGFTDFMDSFINDAAALVEEGSKNGWGFGITKEDGILGGLEKVINGIGGMLMGGLLNSAGRPARYLTNSLLTDAPVGLWHITIGNPNCPIMSLGNMILKTTEIEHSGPLGIDDFPTNLKVTCSFERGKPRDQRELERMYMTGNDRIFHSMEGAIAHMYNIAAEYKHNKKPNIKVKDYAGGILCTKDFVKPSDPGKKPVTEKISVGAAQGQNIEKSMKQINNLEVLNYYFGQTDSYALLLSSGEQGRGASTIKKKETEGDGKSNKDTK